MPEHTAILDFWFSARMRKQWFASTPALDLEIKERFESLWEDAATDKLKNWQQSPGGSLALAIILDQLPLNMYRGEARSFSTAAKARDVAQRAIDAGFDQRLPKVQRAFLYMPLMHSESIQNQEHSVALFRAAGLNDNLHFAEHHRDLIERFGRFPHRNAILNRKSTAEELRYLHSDKAFTH
jgi:uncharacterized protein (DUF924 family)